MATLSTSQVVQTGGDATANGSYAAAAAAGDKFAPGDNVFLNVLNMSDASITVTIGSPRPCDQGSTHPLVVVVPTIKGRFIGPLSANRFAGSDGLVAVTYSAHADLFVRPWLI